MKSSIAIAALMIATAIPAATNAENFKTSFSAAECFVFPDDTEHTDFHRTQGLTNIDSTETITTLCPINYTRFFEMYDIPRGFPPSLSAASHLSVSLRDDQAAGNISCRVCGTDGIAFGTGVGHLCTAWSSTSSRGVTYMTFDLDALLSYYWDDFIWLECTLPPRSADVGLQDASILGYDLHQTN